MAEKMSISGVFPVLNRGDKRAVSWLNDFRVIYAILDNGNQWTYVGQMADKQTKEGSTKIKGTNPVQSLNLEGHFGLTKPGAATASKRLTKKDIGILEVKMAKPPKKAGNSPHYRIRPYLDAFESILRFFHAGALSYVRRTKVGQEIIANDMKRYLVVKFKLDKGAESRIKPSLLSEMAFMAKQSTKALEVLLGPKDSISQVGNETDVGRLRDLMHLAFALDFTTMDKALLKEIDMSGNVSIQSQFVQGGLSLNLDSKIKRES